MIKNNLLVVGLILLFFVYIAGLLFFGSHALMQSARSMSSPSVDSVIVTTSTPSGSPVAGNIHLNESATKAVYVRGSISEPDGCDNLNNNSLKSVYYRSSVANSQDCTADNNNCYRVTYGGGECTISGCVIGNEPSVTYECDYTIQYYADSTDSDGYPSDTWIAWVTVSDDDYATSTNSNFSSEINSLAALDVPSFFSYGDIAIGATSTSDTEVTITNTGNVNIDTYFSGTNMGCTNGGVAANKQRYSLTFGEQYVDMTALATTTQLVHTNLSKTTDGSASTIDSYWKIAIPQNQFAIGGSCQGTNTFSAVVDS